MPKRNRAAERKRQERRPKSEPGWLFAPVGVIVQTEQTWAERERAEDDLLDHVLDAGGHHADDCPGCG